MNEWLAEVARRRYLMECKMYGCPDNPAIYAPPISMPDAAEYYLHWIEKHRSRSCEERLGRLLPMFSKWILDYRQIKLANDLTLEHIAHWRDYLHETGLAASTVNCYLSDIRGWLSWLVDRGHLPCSPADGVKLLEVVRGQTELPVRSPADFWALVRNVREQRGEHWASAVGLLGVTGLRSGELGNLRWDDWEQEQQLLHIRPQSARERTKRHERTIPLPAVADDFLQGMERKGDYMVGGAKRIKGQLNAILKPLRIKPHDLRRFFCSALETIQAPEYVIQTCMGYIPDQTRRAYSGRNNIAMMRPTIILFNRWLTGQNVTEAELSQVAAANADKNDSDGPEILLPSLSEHS